MNRVVVDLHALRHNFEVLVGMMRRQGASWSIVTKALCGHEDTLRALHLLGARSMADSRLDNLRVIGRLLPDVERWYLRLPHPSVAADVVALSDVSLNTEIEVIEALSREAVRQGRTHHVVIMIELGDLREGILPGNLVRFYEQVFGMKGIEVTGIGGQFGCLAGSLPNMDQVAQLMLYRELLELKFRHRLPIISAGSTIFLPLLADGRMPRGVNHYRIGEALFLGTDLVNGGILPGLRDDVIILEGEVAEIKEKNLVPMGETVGSTPFDGLAVPGDEPLVPGQRGYRALVTIGELDTDVHGLTPVDPRYRIAGASSDVTVVNLGPDPEGLKVGDTIRFRTSYSAFVRIMNDPYVPKETSIPVEEFAESLPAAWSMEVAPALASPPAPDCPLDLA